MTPPARRAYTPASANASNASNASSASSASSSSASGALAEAWGRALTDPGVAPELAGALGTLAAVEEVLGSAPQAAGIAARAREPDLGVLVQRLKIAGLARPAGASVAERVRELAADPLFGEVAGDVAVNGGTVDQVSGLGARWLLACDDEAALQVLLAAHAVRALRRLVVDAAGADLTLARFALAAFVAAGTPGRADARGLPQADDGELEARVARAGDDGLARLVAVCLDEERATQDRIYRILATRAARRARG